MTEGSKPPQTMACIMALLLLLPFLGFVLACSYLLFLVYMNFNQQSTSHGPPTLPIVGCLLSFYKNRRRLIDWYTELLAKSRSMTIVVRRLGARRTVVTADPVNVEHMLKTNFINYPKGKPFTDMLGDLLGRGIFSADGDRWYAQRKLASHEFSARSLRELVLTAVAGEASSRLVPLLESAAAQCRAVDLQDLLMRFAFDIICKVSLGTDPGCLSPSLPASGLARAFDAASAIIARRGSAPVPALWKAKRALGVGSERRLREEIKVIHDSIAALIHSRKKELEKEAKSDFLSRLISGGHSEEAVRDMVISFVMAGRDTTSSALTWFFWLLSCHRDVEREIVSEVTETPPEAEFDAESLRRMPLTKASLCESMRLYPPVAWDSKHAINADVLPDGTEIKKGDRVTYFPYGMGRMERVWGKDCLEFRPQRWLAAAAAAEVVSPFKFPVFQGGPRSCLGKEMAFVQMKCVVAAVLRRFELSPVDGGRPVFVPLLTAQMGNGFKVMVRKRDHGMHEYP